MHVYSHGQFGYTYRFCPHWFLERTFANSFEEQINHLPYSFQNLKTNEKEVGDKVPKAVVDG